MIKFMLKMIYLVVFFVISAEEGHSMIPAKPVSIPEGCTKGQKLKTG